MPNTDGSTSLVSFSGQSPASNRGRQRESIIINVATQEFLAEGYGATRIDTIARKAGGSKSTLYKFFPTKADLFYAVVASAVADQHPIALDLSEDVRDSLVGFCYARLSVVFTRRHWSLLRLIQAERDRFPKLAQAYFEIGPEHSRSVLANYFTELRNHGVLSIADPASSAELFIGMLMHEWYLKYLYTPARLPTKREKMKRSELVVSNFLASHASSDKVGN